MINYFIEIFVYQALFIGLYQLLKTEPLFKINRLYLLSSLVISMLLPFMGFYSSTPFTLPETYVQWLQPIQIGAGNLDKTNTDFASATTSTGFQWNFYLLCYGIGLIAYAIWFGLKNKNLFQHLKRTSQTFYRDKKLVILPNTALAFSFWNCIYIGEDISESQRSIILEHEYQHLKHKHSWDMLALEILQFALWFNPLIYVYKNHLRQIHEFEADRLVTQNTSKTTYVNTLLNQSFGCQNISFVNSFYHHSNLKTRITMLHKTTLNRLKYLLILPVFSLALLWSCSQDSEINQDMTQEEQHADMKDFFDEISNSSPSLFKKIDNKTDLQTLLNAYDIEIKDEYSKHEEGKVAFIIGVLKLSDEYKNDQDYQDSIDETINKSKGLQQTVEKLEEIMKNDNISTAEGGEESDSDSSIPFALIDQVPHPASCNGKTGEALKTCVSKYITKHVNQNFNTGLGAELDLTGRNRVSVQFKIDKTGNIIDVRARGPHPDLEEEAKRVIRSLPQMIPGQNNGENVGVLYGLPINFIIQE